MKIKTSTQALAILWSCDVGDVKDSRYHGGHTSIPVYSSDDGYWCSSKTKPAVHYNDDILWEWKEVKDNFVNSQGWKIWKCEI